MTRQETVQSLVLYDRPLDVLREGVAAFPYDWPGPPLATLRRDHVISVLERWERGQLSASEVEDWANLVETRDDLDHDPADPRITRAVFDLANPLLQGDLGQVAPALIRALMTDRADSFTDAFIPQGSAVRYDGLGESGPEFGIVVHCWRDPEIEAYDCYVAFFGTAVPIGKPSEKPYVLRYSSLSLARLQEFPTKVG